jgi:hypothetical protein
MSVPLETAFEIVGALLILAAFALDQFRGLDRHGAPYLLLNVAGSVILAVIAANHRQWGFFVLQTVWGIVALWGLLALARGRPAS